MSDYDQLEAELITRMKSADSILDFHPVLVEFASRGVSQEVLRSVLHDIHLSTEDEHLDELACDSLDAVDGNGWILSKFDIYPDPGE